MKKPLTLYQAEWCPFSSAVREVLTELGIDFVARQVEPWPEERAAMQEAAGTDQIPTLIAEDGQVYRGTRQIFNHLREREGWEHAAAHRHRFADHQVARESDVTGQLIEFFRGTDELEEASGPTDRAEVVNVPEASRYELRLDGKLVGLAAYRRRDGRISFTHTEVDESLEGRGLGSRLVQAALDDIAGEDIVVLPLCPFVAHYIEKHPEYQRLLPDRYRQSPQ